MINWLNLLFNSIWVIGAALALSVLSIAYARSQRGGEKLKSLLGEKPYALNLNIAGVLFCFGIALTSERLWEIVLWGILMLGFCYQAYVNKKF